LERVKCGEMPPARKWKPRSWRRAPGFAVTGDRKCWAFRSARRLITGRGRVVAELLG
jgi:hypothetical protein